MRIRENTSREQHERAGGLIQLHEERSSNIAYTCIYLLSRVACSLLKTPLVFSFLLLWFIVEVSSSTLKS